MIHPAMGWDCRHDRRPLDVPDEFDHHPIASGDTPRGASAAGASAASSQNSVSVVSPQIGWTTTPKGGFNLPSLPPPAIATEATTPAANCMPSWPELAAVLSNLDVYLRAHAPGDVYRPTAYHSSVMPPTPLVHFAHFICARTRYDVTGLAIAVALLARRSAAGRPLCALSMHRVLLACIVVGAKANFDRFIRNDHVAGLCGVELSELNFLEATLLRELDWRVTPPAMELANPTICV